MAAKICFDVETIEVFLDLWKKLDGDIKDTIPASMLEAVGAMGQAYKDYRRDNELN
jgi:hypothetical protein